MNASLGAYFIITFEKNDSWYAKIIANSVTSNTVLIRYHNANELSAWQELATTDTFITKRMAVPYTVEVESAITINPFICGIDGYSLIMCTMEATGGNEVYCYNNMVQGADRINVQLKNTTNKKVEATAYFMGLYKKN